MTVSVSFLKDLKYLANLKRTKFVTFREIEKKCFYLITLLPYFIDSKMYTSFIHI